MNIQIPLLLLSLFYSILANAAVIKISVENIEKKSIDSPIAIAIFSSKKGFPKKNKFAISKSFIKTNHFPLNIKVPKGEYAIAIFHDQNKNQELDTNFIGIPKEPFGFSNNTTLIMGPPSFKKAKVTVPSDNSIVETIIKLKRFL